MSKITKEKLSESALKEIVENKLEQAGAGGLFVWSIFLLCVTPNILSGFHIASYTILGHPPDDQWCAIAGLSQTNWSINEQRAITARGLTTKGCTIWDWNYEQLSRLTYEEAFNFTEEIFKIQAPNEIACKEKGAYNYLAPETTFVADWQLVCEKAIQRTSAQMLLSLGRFFGSFSFGILADKYGRKSAFTLAAVIFIVSSICCTFSLWYWLFLVGRFGLGLASSGLSYPAFTIIVENISLKHRSYMSHAFSAAYSVGMILLGVLTYFIQPWRYLQLALTVPALLLIFNCYLMNESPRWLISQRRYLQAYKILFKKKCHYEIDWESENFEMNNGKIRKNIAQTGTLQQFWSLFATWPKRRLIFTSYFMFFVSSLCYYVTALNAPNLSFSRHLYVAFTGLVDLPSYLVPIIMLRFRGRRLTTMSLFLATGLAFLLVLAVPASATFWVISLAMFGRLGISATYSIVALYTAELYATEVRNTVLGTSFTWSHVGSILAPYIVDFLGQLGWYIPTTICGCAVLLAALLTLGLPETAKEKLANKLQIENENQHETTKFVEIKESRNCE